MRNLRPVPDTPPRAIIYLRQSTYREDSISLELQEIACRDYCDRSGYDVVGVEADPGISGRTWKRPAVQRVMDTIEAREADVIVLWKWSRLSRSRKDWALAADRVDIAGGRIESATEPIDTATASGRFARGVMTEYAAFQSEQIGEQWEEVRQRRLNLGLPASGRLPYGWRWIKGEGIEQHPEQAPVVVEMYRRYLDGLGSAAIAYWLNDSGILGPNSKPWTRVRPFTVLDSPIHAGLIPYRGKTYPGAHEPIIDMLTWENYLDERGNRRDAIARPREYEHLLSSLVWCSCGSRMNGKGSITGGHLYTGYICAASRTATHPQRAYISSLVLNPPIVKWFIGLETVIADAAAGVGAASSMERDRINRELSKIEDGLARMMLMVSGDEGLRPTFNRAREIANDETRRLQAELRKVDRVERVALDPAMLAEVRANWDDAEVADKNLILRRFIKRIDLLPDDENHVRITTSWKRSSILSLR